MEDTSVLEIIRESAVQEFDKITNGFGKSIEEGIYNYAIERLDDTGYAGQEELPYHELKTMYKQVLVKVLMNLKFNKNKEDLISKIKNKTINSEDIAKLHREVLYPEKWDSLAKKRGSAAIKKKKGAHKCPRCKSWYTEYIEMQTRSADEAATVKVSCECGYHWRLG